MFAYLNFSDSGADCCHVMGTSGWQKSSQEGPFLQKQNELYLTVLQSDNQAQFF